MKLSPAAEGLIAFAILVGYLVVHFIVDYLRNSTPLTEEEVQRLAIKKRLKAISTIFADDVHISINPDFKRKLKTDGEFIRIDEPLREWPSISAALLKGKKHEWVVFGFATDNRVHSIWVNKGNDNQSVAPTNPIGFFIQHAKVTGTSHVMRTHNHPAGALAPSSQDLVSAKYCGQLFTAEGFHFFDFVAAQGEYIQYGWWPRKDLIPLSGILESIGSLNNTNRSNHYEMRMELKKKDDKTSLLLSENNVSCEYE
jgi:hypothetical protein